MRNQNQTPKAKNKAGFTLIELLVVIAIIALLSSVALIAFMSARAKGRDAKRIAEMTQMATAMELYFNTNRGYPTSSIAGSPDPLVPSYLSSLPVDPEPADGSCGGVSYPVGGNGQSYYYYPSPTGGSYVTNGITLYPDYVYYFCLGQQTGAFPPGVHYVTPRGIR